MNRHRDCNWRTEILKFSQKTSINKGGCDGKKKGQSKKEEKEVSMVKISNDFIKP
jgi:hypothetical protein